MPRVMELTTPLGPDVLLFHGLHAREELSRLTECHYDLLSENGSIQPDDILGKDVTLRVELPDGSGRFFNGYVTRFSQGGKYGRYHRYFAVVRPWLWFLTRTADCKIFQDKTVPEIIQKVFADHPTAKVKMELTGSYRQWTYCVQYRETDFNFVSRLMEHEGMYYYFRHEEGQHSLVITDSTAKHQPTEGYEALRFLEERLARPDDEYVSTWDFTREVQPGVFVHDDYDFERPSVELRTRKPLRRTYTPSDYEIYDYPGQYIQTGDGSQYAAARIDEYGSLFEICQAQTNARGVSTGSLFTLDGCPRADQNREHIITAATYDLEFSDYEAMPQRGGTSYRCNFVAMSTAQQFRPRRTTLRPFVQGPQTAVVVGPAGDEIYTDKYGRVKVQFHWDRYGEKNENSSCWIRVSHPWAGKAWGAISLPRIGQEVLVDFLEGDPDQPIVTGRVYNAEHMPPYALPDNMTQSGIKSRSTKGGGPDNFNEIRFEDLKGSEQLFIHAEKNQDIEVENDETHWVGHDRRKTIDHDEVTHVKHDRTETVDNNETITISGNRVESVAKNESISIDKSRTENVAENDTISVSKDHTLTIGGDKALSVSKKESISIGDSRTDEVAKNEERTVGKNRQVSVGENDSLEVGKRFVLDVGDQITIQSGDASIVMKKDGTITIKGKDITLQGSGKINVKASSDVIVKGSKVLQN